MKLQAINKSRYRTHLNRLIIGCGISLLVLSLATSTMLIALVGISQGSNFNLNVMAVVISCIIIATALNHYKLNPWMTEIYYVWLLKKELNLINRKLPAIDKAAAKNDRTAMIILNFSYQGSKQLWQLDDNTITLDLLTKKMAELAERLALNNFDISSDDYDSALLSDF